MAFSFLSILSFVLFGVVIGMPILRTKTTAAGITNIVLVSLIIQPLDWSNVLQRTSVIQSMLNVENAANIYTDAVRESYNLRPEGREYIPVSVVDGYGEVLLTSQPDVATYLDVYECARAGEYDRDIAIATRGEKF